MPTPGWKPPVKVRTTRLKRVEESAKQEVVNVPLLMNMPDPPATIAEAIAANPNLKAGDQLTAPLSRAKGPIDAVEGSLVVTVIKDFWSSPTILAIKNAVLAAVGLAVFGVATQIVSVNGDYSHINWQTTQKLAIGAIAFSLASAYAAWWKRRDNDPVRQG